jgi:hypothetical protein
VPSWVRIHNLVMLCDRLAFSVTKLRKIILKMFPTTYVSRHMEANHEINKNAGCIRANRH